MRPRKIYFLSVFASIILIIIANILNSESIGVPSVVLILIYTTFVAIHDFDNDLSTKFGVFFKPKKIKTISNYLGSYCVRITNKNEVILYIDRFIYLEKLESYQTTYSIGFDEKLKGKILKYIEEEEIKLNHEKRVNKNLNEWDGCLDKQTERDEKLNKLV